MTTELSFLIELLLKHKLDDTTKDLLASRIREVEERINMPQFNNVIMRQPLPAPMPPHIAAQSPSTQALLLKHGMATSGLPEPPMTIVPAIPVDPPVVTVIAQTPATQAALESRKQLMSGKPKTDPATGRPRKF